MKNIIACILSLLSVNTLYAQYGGYPVYNIVQNGRILDLDDENDIPLTAEKTHIRGQVRSVSFTDYSFKNGKRKLVHKGRNDYNQRGQLIKQYISDLDFERKLTCNYTWENDCLLWYEEISSGSHSDNSRTTFRYDNSGHLIEKTNTGITAPFNVIQRITYEYIGDNMIMDTDYGSNNEIKRQTAWKYDDLNRQVAYEQLPAEDSSGLIETRQYDGKGYKTAGSIIGKNGHFIEKWTMKNDEKGNPVERTEYKENGSVYWTTKYTYDSMNNETGRITYEADGTPSNIYEWGAPSVSEYAYDVNGNITKYTLYAVNLGGRMPSRTCHDMDMNYYYKLKPGKRAPLCSYEMKYTYWK